MDADEIAHAEWYTRDQLTAKLDSGELGLPGDSSIASRMIQAWRDGEARSRSDFHLLGSAATRWRHCAMSSRLTHGVDEPQIESDKISSVVPRFRARSPQEGTRACSSPRVIADGDPRHGYRNPEKRSNNPVAGCDE